MAINIIPKPNTIVTYCEGSRLVADDEFVYMESHVIPEEGYEIRINKDKAVVSYKTEKGLFYAKQTLEQLQNSDGSYPFVKISDAPRFAYRAFMIDSSRHMQSIHELKTYIEAASKFKFNVFHWHLTDDQGWRIESEKYPELNRIGSYRNYHGFGSKNMNRYGGYYTKAQIREIVEFCKKRHIDVIPEVDIPGHTVSAIASYPLLSCRGQSIGVATNPGVHKDILCAGREETFKFCFDILDEVMELFPYEYIHIGGDEAPKERWEECEDCRRRMKEEKLVGGEQLQGYFVNRIVDYLKSKGKKAIAWNESLNSGMLDSSVTIADWMDKEHRSENWANCGGKVIVEDFFHYYLDYPYGMTSLKKTYNYNPMLEKLNGIGMKNIIGVETPIWTEFVEDFDRLCYMCFPRMMAVAEAGWTQEDEKDYKSFAERAESKREMLSFLGIEMADSSEWTPSPLKKLGGLAEHYSHFVNGDTIRSWLGQKKD